MSAGIWAPVAFVGVTLAICLVMLYLPSLLGGKSAGDAKEEIFEGGVVSTGTAKLRISASFYLIAIFFVIFDLEALYLYVYAVSVREVGWAGFYTALAFALVLLVGLIYELSLGTLNWAPENKYPVITPPDADNFNLAEATAYTSFTDLAADRTGKIPAQSAGTASLKETKDD